MDRFQERQRSRGATDGDFERWDALIEHYGERIVQPLELGCRRIDVSTDEGYEPTLDDLIRQVAPDLTSRTAVRFLSQ